MRRHRLARLAEFARGGFLGWAYRPLADFDGQNYRLAAQLRHSPQVPRMTTPLLRVRDTPPPSSTMHFTNSPNRMRQINAPCGVSAGDLSKGRQLRPARATPSQSRQFLNF